MIRFLIQRPIAVFMTTLAFIIMGLAASRKIPTSLMPDIPVPEITVQLSYPGNTARELETNVVRPLRNHLLQVARLKDIHSSSQDGFATLSLLFDFGTDTDLAFIEVNEKVDAALTYLPRNLERPKVIKASATDIPIVNLTVTLRNEFSNERFLELSEFAESVLKRRTEQLPGVALADLSGLSRPELVVYPNTEKLQSLGLNAHTLVEAIRKNNMDLGNLSVQSGIYSYHFKLSNPLQSKKDIESIYLNIHDQLFQLSELAKVQLQPAQDRGLVYVNGKRAIVMAIIKQANAKVYDLQKDLEMLSDAFAGDYPDLLFSTNQDQTRLLKLSINNLKSSLWIGSSLAILIMFFFLKDLKSPFVIAISIPVSLIVSLLLMYLLDVSINIISLSGLILGVGMMIDNAIIVIDNITQKLEEGNPLSKACTTGTTELITPLISSVLTTCSVFLPLLFLSGLTGALFYDQALVVAIGLGASLIVSIFLIPVIYSQLHRRRLAFEKSWYSSTQVGWLENLYERGYHFFFKRKIVVLGLAVLSCGLAVLFFRHLPYAQLPDLNQSEVMLELDWNENISINENKERIHQLLSQFAELEVVYAKIGEQQFLLQRENNRSFSQASIYLKATSTEALKSIKAVIIEQLKKQYRGVSVKMEEPKNVFQHLFGSRKPPIQLQVAARDGLEVPREEHLPEIKELICGFSDSEVPLRQTAFIEILQESVLLYGVEYEDLIHELKNICNQHFVDHLKAMQRFIPIQIAYGTTDFEKMVNEAFVRNRRQELIAVRNLIRIYPAEQYKTIEAGRGGEYLPFVIQGVENIPRHIKALQTTFRNHSRYDIRLGGSFFELQQLKRELIAVVGVAILLLYFIMAAQFESLWQPLIILMEVPIDLGGALLFLWLFGGAINVMAAIGMVVMSGVIINDSILKLHTINLLRKEGLDIREAIRLGGKKRMKPILMTSLTTILALLPFLFMGGLGAALQKPLALTVIGGMLIGTFISLYFIPLMYYWLNK